MKQDKHVKDMHANPHPQGQKGVTNLLSRESCRVQNATKTQEWESDGLFTHLFFYQPNHTLEADWQVGGTGRMCRTLPKRMPFQKTVTC